MKPSFQLLLLLVSAIAVKAASLDQVPEGLAASDWQSIRAAYDAGRHTFQPVPGKEGVWQARNPGQQWLTTFDQSGFEARPQDGGWTWGLTLNSYGFGENQISVNGQPMVKAEGQRLSYQWDHTVQEWWVNDQRGLEHGFTISKRPDQTDGVELSFLLKTRGGSHPTLTADAKGVLFQDDDGTTLVNYTGLKVWDADGKNLAARFEAVGESHVRLLVDERTARYPITIDPIAQQAYLKASNTGAGDQFGLSVAVSGDTAVIGAYAEDSNAIGVNAPVLGGSGTQANDSAPESGAAYVFTRNNGVWSQQAYLKASNTGGGDQFGYSVAIDGDTIAIGARWEGSNATGVNAPLSGGSGTQEDNSAGISGAVYIFTRSAGIWSQQAYLKASNTDSGDEFGAATAVDGDTVIIGARWESGNATGINAPVSGGSGTQADNSASLAGAAYVFTRNAGVWSQQAYLKASNAEAEDWFGISVDVSGDTAIVGAWREDSNATGVNPPLSGASGTQADNSAGDSGAAYVFKRNAGVWSQQACLKASNTGAGDNFGLSVALDGPMIVVGALRESSTATGINAPVNGGVGTQSDNSADGAGAAYIFTHNGSVWSQEAYLKASNTDAGDEFGIAVAASGNTVVIGARWESSNATGVNAGVSGGPGTQADNSASGSGAAYVFTRSGSVWTQKAYLKASNTGAGDSFGEGVAVDGGTVVVGALLEDGNATGVNAATTGDTGTQMDNSASDAGAAYAFTLPVTELEILVPPLDKQVAFGGSATFSVSAVGIGSLSYQWRKNSVATPNGASSTLTLTNVNFRDAGSYDVIVTDDEGLVTSVAATLIVTSRAPNVSISPGDTTVALGGGLTFTATVATGLLPYTYQWRKNGAAIAKATNATLVLTNIQRTQEGVYDVVVKNGSGVDVSNPARLSLPPVVPVTNSPESTDVNPAGTATFTVNVPGATAWQWLKNGVAIKGAITSTLNVPNVDASSAGLYSVIVTTPNGKVTTAPAQLRINDSGMLIYKLTGTGKAYAGTVATNAALSGYLVLDRAGQRGGLIIGSKSGSQNIHRLEIHDDLDTQSTGPVPKSQTVVSELVAGEFALWMDGTDGLLTISKTDKAVGPATMKGSANSIDLGSNVRIETVSLTLTLDAVNSTPARLFQETVEQAMSRISQDMQAKGSALVE